MFHQNVRRIVFTVCFSLSFPVYAEKLVASESHLRLIQNVSDNYTLATATGTKSLNPVKILKLNPLVISIFQNEFPDVSVLSSSTKKFIVDDRVFANENYAQLSETGYRWRAQCVAFAKAMVGSTISTSHWYAGLKLGDIAVSELDTHLVPGTMIAFFDGFDTYNGSDRHHVAILLSVQKDAKNNPISITVIDQNFINGYSTKIGETTYSRSDYVTADINPIAIHNLSWNVSGKTSISASQYSIVDVR